MVITNGSFTIKVAEVQRSDVVHCLPVRWYSSIKDVKDLLHECTGHPPSAQHLFHPSQPSEFRNASSLQELGIDHDGFTLMVLFDIKANTSYSVEALKPELLDSAGSTMLADVRVGLNRNQSPKVTDELDGSSGVYFFRSSAGQYAAVFKPRDEEQGMPNNPKSFQGAGQIALREHYRPGQGCLREVAAYILDYNNFCGVPPTVLIHCQHSVLHYPKVGGKTRIFPKIGSLQKFIPAPDCFDDFGPSQFSDFEVQKIALLDLRLLNCDRNGANMLVRRKPYASIYHSSSASELANVEFEGQADEIDWQQPQHSGASPAGEDRGGGSHDVYELIPIDHGYCMPSKLQITEYDLAWLYMPQVKKPVHPDILSYVAALDFELLLRNVLDQIVLPGNCIFLLALAHVLVVRGITAGLTLFDIANLVVRMESEDRPSKLELAIEEAEENAFRAVEFHNQRASNGQFMYNTTQTAEIEMDLSSSPNPGSRMVDLGGIHLTEVPFGTLTPSRSNRFDGSSPGGSLASSLSMNELRSASGSPLRRLGSSPECISAETKVADTNVTPPRDNLHPIDVVPSSSTPRSKAPKAMSPSISKSSFLRPALLTTNDSDAADGTSEDESIGDVDDQFLMDIFSTASSVDVPPPLHNSIMHPTFHTEPKGRGLTSSSFTSSGLSTPSKTAVTALPSIVEERRHRENSVSSTCSSEHNGTDESTTKDASAPSLAPSVVVASASYSSIAAATSKGNASSSSVGTLSCSSALVSAINDAPRALSSSNSIISNELMATFPPMSNIGVPLMRLRSLNSSPSPSALLSPPISSSSSNSLSSYNRSESESPVGADPLKRPDKTVLVPPIDNDASFQHGEGLDIDECDAACRTPSAGDPRAKDSLRIVAPYLREHSSLLGSNSPQSLPGKCSSSPTSLIAGFSRDLDLDRPSADGDNGNARAGSGACKRMYTSGSDAKDEPFDGTYDKVCDGNRDQSDAESLSQKRCRQGSTDTSPKDASSGSAPSCATRAGAASMVYSTPMRPIVAQPVALNSAESHSTARSGISNRQGASHTTSSPHPVSERDSAVGAVPASIGMSPAPALTRVVSFSGFPSAPIYDLNAEGRFGNLRQEKRQAIAQTPEFNRFRLQFAHEAVLSLVARTAKGKPAV